MRRWITLSVLIGLLGVLAYVSRNLWRSGLRLGGAPSVLESRWHTEEEWLVDSIVRDLAEMALYARERRIPRPGEVEVVVTAAKLAGVGPVSVAVTAGAGRRVEQSLSLESFVWSPWEYRDLAQAMLEGATAPPDAAEPEPAEDLLELLTNLRADVIEKANQRVSHELARRFTDPNLHEGAALVLSAFVLREAAAEYSDHRAGLCRMTAHLALAAALRGDSPPSVHGRVAEAALLVLAARGADAATALDALDREPDAAGLAPWRRALRLRLTDDARAAIENPTLLERREVYRARLSSGDRRAAVALAEELLPEPLTDRWRLAARVGLSVEAGNVLLRDALEMELQEARELARLSRGVALEDPGLISALNEPAVRCVTPVGPRVIGWGTWAAFLQRHLVSCLWRRDHHLRGMLALHDEADRQLDDTERRFSRLRLYPLIEIRCATDASRRPTQVDDLVDLTVAAPEFMSAWPWTSYARLSQYEVVDRRMPEPSSWFRPTLPRGTTFDLELRWLSSLVARDPDRLRGLLVISPLDIDAAEALAEEQFGDKGGAVKTVHTLEEVAPLFGARAEYDRRALERLSGIVARHPRSIETVLRRRCSMVADDCHTLGHFLVEVGDLAGAAQAYQRGLDHGADQVLASQEARWLMNHYLDTGQRDRARAVAERVGATGSCGGLTTLARFCERTGLPERAESLLRQVLERYGNQPMEPGEREDSRDGDQDEDSLIAFYYRMAYQRNDPRYEARFHELADDDFPNGLERVELGGFPPSAPTDGVQVLRTRSQADRLGFRAGDIIVALDGYRVRSLRQYVVVNRFSDTPETRFIVFRHPAYVELRARSASRLYGLDLRSHRSPTRRQ